MGFVDAILQQFSGPLLGSISSFLGTSEGSTMKAVRGGAPALFSALSSLASGASGSQKLASVLGRFDAGSVERMMGEGPGSIAEQGSSMAESLLGSPTVSGIAGQMSRFSGIPEGAASKLLGFLMPMMLGGLAKKFAGRTLTPQSLSAFFSEQRAEAPDHRPAHEAHSGIGARGGGRWVLPALLGVLVLGLIWVLSQGRTPKVPETAAPFTTDVTSLGKDAGEAISSLTSTLAGIKDGGSLQESIPKIKEMSETVSELQAQASKLPEEGRSAFSDMIKPLTQKLEEETARVGSIPGGEAIKPTLDGLMSRLHALSGAAPPADVK
jgi:hypothetical protein